jgi:hypothetical protein
MTKIVLVGAAAMLALSVTAAMANDKSYRHGPRYSTQAHGPRYSTQAFAYDFAYGPRPAFREAQQSWYEWSQAEQLRIGSQ